MNKFGAETMEKLRSIWLWIEGVLPKGPGRKEGSPASLEGDPQVGGKWQTNVRCSSVGDSNRGGYNLQQELRMAAMIASLEVTFRDPEANKRTKTLHEGTKASEQNLYMETQKCKKTLHGDNKTYKYVT